MEEMKGDTKSQSVAHTAEKQVARQGDYESPKNFMSAQDLMRHPTREQITSAKGKAKARKRLERKDPSRTDSQIRVGLKAGPIEQYIINELKEREDAVERQRYGFELLERGSGRHNRRTDDRCNRSRSRRCSRSRNYNHSRNRNRAANRASSHSRPQPQSPRRQPRISCSLSRGRLGWGWGQG